MVTAATEKINLEFLIPEEELDQLKDIRVKTIPKKINQIGEGTYGKVFLFRFEDGSFRAGKKPKINLYKKSAEEESQMKKHLSYAFHEIKMLHQLNHERIIKFCEFYLDQSQIIIFMEAMKGSVKDEINKKGCLSEMEAMNYITQAAEGLVYLHSRKPRAIIHRDIKCENLLLTAEKNLKLADFGLAVDLAISSGSVSLSSNAPTNFVGTHHFTAPEVIGKMDQPEAYGRKSDIWSLACTLVQMINGKPPYGNLNFFEFAQRSSSNSHNPLTYSGDLLLPTISYEIRKLLNSMFIIDCKLRPSAEKVLAFALDVAQTLQNNHENESRKQDDNARHSSNSINNGLQNINMNKQQTLIEMESTVMIHNAENLANIPQQKTTFNYVGHETNLSGTLKTKGDSSFCRSEAEQGNAKAQTKLGDAYYFGQSMSQSDEEAVKWYTRSAEQGNAKAQYNLGNMYEMGKGVPQSDEEAVKWYRKSTEQGNGSAQAHLGLMYNIGQGAPQSYDEAVKWYTKSAEQGNAKAQFKLGVMFKNGRGVPQSDEEAVKWYRKAAEQENADAQLNLGWMYDEGKGVPQSDGEAVKWYTKSAEQGHADAQLNLGWMYDEGKGVPQSDGEAVKWYTKSAEQGNAKAQFNFGVKFKNGRGVPQSDEEAVKWFKKSAEHGNADAQCDLGLMYQCGRGVHQSDEEAVKWFTVSAKQGNADAQYNLGFVYKNSRGVPQSDEEAVKWFEKSAEQGNAKAQANLGLMFQCGRGIPQSDEEAVKWYIKSAEQGDARAQCNLGFMYLNRRGVTQSDEEAVKWFTISAKQGNADAQCNLGIMYKNGQGVPQSDGEAISWFRKSGEQGNANAQSYLRKMSKKRQGILTYIRRMRK